ncbi:DYW_deaminase domain-containing protein [Psidium guajava]|nr:DYW_deaminase domain-containing protein [Psidium guajava]
MHNGVDAFKQSKVEDSRYGKKRKKPLNEEVVNAWNNFSMKLEAACVQIGASSAMFFLFVEGALYMLVEMVSGYCLVRSTWLLWRFFRELLKYLKERMGVFV